MKNTLPSYSFSDIASSEKKKNPSGIICHTQKFIHLRFLDQMSYNELNDFAAIATT